MVRSLLQKTLIPSHLHDGIIEILQDYGSSGLDSSALILDVAEIEELLQLISSNGITHESVALTIHRLVSKYQLKRGMYKSLLMLQFGAALTSDETHQINNIVHIQRSLAVPLEEFEKTQYKLKTKILCYAHIAELFTGKRQKYASCFIYLFDLGWIFLPLFKKKCGLMGYQFEQTIFKKFCRGGYLKFGWIILSRESKHGIEYRLTPVVWDGDRVPSEGLSFDEYQQFKK